MKLCIWHIIVASYIIIYVASIPWYLFLHRFKDNVSENILIAFLNQNFIIRYGYFLFTVAYFSEAISYNDVELIVSRSSILNISKKYGIYSLCTAILLGWFFGPLLYERVNESTGGYCDTGQSENPISRQFQCMKIPGAQWVDGFDVSGHIYILLTMCLLLWEKFLENLNLRHFSQNFEGYTSLGIWISEFDLDCLPSITVVEEGYHIQTDYSYMMHLVCTAFTVSLLTIWSVMYIVTCVFFHTLTEKLVLLMIGIIISVGITSLG